MTLATVGSLNQAMVEAEVDAGRIPFLHCDTCERELDHPLMPANFRASFGGLAVSCCRCAVPVAAATEIRFLDAASSGWRFETMDGRLPA